MIVDKTNIEFMKSYLQQAITFEKAVYIWSNALNTAQGQVKHLTNQSHSLENDIRSTEQTLNTIDEKVIKSIQYKQREIERCREGIKRRNRPVKIILLVMLAIVVLAYIVNGIAAAAVAGFALFAVFIAYISFFSTTGSNYDNEKLQEYTESLQNSQDQNQARRQKLLLSEKHKTLESDRQTVVAKLAIASNNQSKVSDTLAQAKQALNEVYALEVLPRKYRGLAAVTTLYEYLETGRCNAIEGHGGIYDTYEVDLQRGIIIETLKDIRDSMYRIEANQHLLYDQLQEANSSLSAINSELHSFHQSFSNYSAASLAMQQQQVALLQWAEWKNR